MASPAPPPPMQVGVGVELSCVPDLRASVDTLVGVAGASFVLVPLVHPRRRRRPCPSPSPSPPWSPSPSPLLPLTRSDLCLASSEWRRCVVAAVSSRWMYDFSASAAASWQVDAFLQQEMEWALHVGVSAAVFPEAPSSEAALVGFGASLARCALRYGSGAQLWLRTSVSDWAKWHRLHRLTDFNASVLPLLQVSEDLPCRSAWSRWLGEDVAAVLIPLAVFTSVSPSNPTAPPSVSLSQPHASFVAELLRRDVRVVLKGPPLTDPDTPTLLKPFMEYLQTLATTNADPGTAHAADAALYRDFLQAPLQPLMDNLSSDTYQVFEKDSVKYERYEEAVFMALSEKFSDREEDVVVLVAGAGRGPLVNASLRAASRANVRVQLFAMEKNPNAVITLLGLQREVWGDSVTVLPGDMRLSDAAVRAHVLVSELLGSFGDNELSPECLDGAQHLLRDDGVSIPASYTSFVAPIACSRLWNSIRSASAASLETPHVVNLHSFTRVAPPQPCFRFQHPRAAPSDLRLNNRSTHLAFPIACDGVVHGLAGYFSAVLYGDVTLSIEPATHSPSMYSWFPLLLPLQRPLRVHTSDDVLNVHVYRSVDTAKRRVWYEWAVHTHSASTALHNANGRSYWIGL